MEQRSEARWLRLAIGWDRTLPGWGFVVSPGSRSPHRSRLGLSSVASCSALGYEFLSFCQYRPQASPVYARPRSLRHQSAKILERRLVRPPSSEDPPG